MAIVGLVNKVINFASIGSTDVEDAADTIGIRESKDVNTHFNFISETLPWIFLVDVDEHCLIWHLIIS